MPMNESNLFFSFGFGIIKQHDFSTHTPLISWFPQNTIIPFQLSFKFLDIFNDLTYNSANIFIFIVNEIISSMIT